VATNQGKFLYADLFAGIGGFAAALEAFGGKNAYSVEKDKVAAEVYKRNWGHDPLGDITLDANEDVMTVKKHDVLVAGFPCQPFSKSGSQLGMEETRGTLYFNILQIIKTHHPAVVVLENVRNLYGPRHMHEWGVIIKTLRDEKYIVSDRPAILSPHQLPYSMGGRPQTRERVFITATYAPHLNTRDINPEPVTLSRQVFQGWNPNNWNLAKDLPMDNSVGARAAGLSTQEIAWIEAWDEWLKIYLQANDDKKPPGFPIWVDAWVELSKLNIPAGTPRWKELFLQKNAELYTANKREFDSWLAKHEVLSEKFPASRRKLEWQAQNAKSLWDCVMHFRPSGIRVKKATYLPALVAITQTSIYGPQRRRLTSSEAKRLQGFPEWFNFGNQRESATFKQLGNGVNIGVVWNIFKLHVERDLALLKMTSGGKRVIAAVAKSPASPDAILESLRASAKL
jgi:DNA (cytosine-5)-methyltransferase 1